MKCFIPPEDKSGVTSFSCTNTYCPPNATNPAYGNFTVSVCIYTQSKTNTSELQTNMLCEKRDFCQSTCADILQNTDNLSSVNVSVIQHGDIPVVLLKSSYGSQAGNWTDSNSNFFYTVIRVTGPDATKSAANHQLDVSLLLPLVLIELLSINMMKKSLF